MALDLGSLFVHLGVEDAEFTQAMQKAAQTGSQTARKLSDDMSGISGKARGWMQSVDDAAGRFSKTFTKIATGGAVAMAGKAVIGFAGQFLDAASDLNEVQNVVDVTFENSAETVNTWAKTTAKQYGLAERQAKQYASTTGAMLKSAGLASDQVLEMSTRVAELTGDMASFYNLDFETAFEKIRSGLTGEIEPLRALGINLSEVNLSAFAASQGIEKAYSQMTEAEKIALRYNYMMSATADAQGDFARTSTGYANALRTFQNNITTAQESAGQMLLPVVESALNTFNSLFASLTATNDDVDSKIAAINQSYDERMAALKTQTENAGVLLGALDNMAESGITPGDTEQWETWKGVLQELTQMYPSLKEYVDGTTGLISTGATDAQKWSAAVQTLIQKTPELADVLNPETGGLRGGVEQVKAWSEATSALVKDYPDLTSYVQAQTAAIENGKSPREAWKSVLGELVRLHPELTESVNTQNASLRDGVALLKAHVSALQQEKIAQEQYEHWKALKEVEAEAQAKVVETGAARDVQAEKVKAERDTFENALQERDDLIASLQKELKSSGLNWEDYYNDSLGYTGLYASTLLDIAQKLNDKGILSADEAQDWLGSWTEKFKQSEDSLDHLAERAGSAEIALDGLNGEFNRSEKELQTATDAAEEYINGLSEAEKQAMDIQKASDGYTAILDKENAAIASLTESLAKLSAMYEQTKAASDAALQSAIDSMASLDKVTKKDKDGNTYVTRERPTMMMGDLLSDMKYATKQIEDYGRYVEEAFSRSTDEAYQRYVANLASRFDDDSRAQMAAIANASDYELQELIATIGAQAAAKDKTSEAMTQAQLSTNDDYQEIKNAAQEQAQLVQELENSRQNFSVAVENLTTEAQNGAAAMDKAIDELNAAMSECGLVEIDTTPLSSGLNAQLDVMGGAVKEAASLRAAYNNEVSQFGNVPIGGFSLGSMVGSVVGGITGNFFNPRATHAASGLERVPYDGYPVIAHKDETILPASDAAQWRQMKHGGGMLGSGASAQEIASAVSEALRGALVEMDGEAVGRLVTPTVDAELGRRAERRRFF